MPPTDLTTSNLVCEWRVFCWDMCKFYNMLRPPGTVLFNDISNQNLKQPKGKGQKRHSINLIVNIFPNSDIQQELEERPHTSGLAYNIDGRNQQIVSQGFLRSMHLRSYIFHISFILITYIIFCQIYSGIDWQTKIHWTNINTVKTYYKN